ncbi:MAG: DNA primase [Candidatus Methylacidiphilales bacterium]
MSRMIPDEIVDQVRRASDIVDIIQGYFPLKRAGANWKALSPFQKEKTPSFTVSPSRQMFNCFSSKHAGDVFKFVQLYENVDFPTAVRKLADRAGIPIPEDGPDDGGAARNMRRALQDVHNTVAAWWAKLLHSSSAAKAGRDYLSSRAMGSALAKEWGLGYAPDGWESTLQYVRKKGFPEEVLRESGLFTWKEESPGRMYDRFRGRLMFPICDDSGQVIAFSGRALDPEAKGAKYVNSPETPLFRKGHIFFGLHKTKRPIIEAQQVVLCEGQIDLIRMWEHGIRNVVAPQGTAFTDAQGAILKRLAREVVICFDADRAGLKAAEKSAEMLLASDLTIRIATMPTGEDPDSLLRKGGKAAMDGVLTGALDYFDHLLNMVTAEHDVASPRGKTAAVERMVSVLRLIQNPVMQEAIGLKVAGRLRLPFEMLKGEMARQKGPNPRFAEMSEPDLTEKGGDLAAPQKQAASFACAPSVRDLLSLLLLNPQLVPTVQRELNTQWLEGLEGGSLLVELMSAHADDAFEDIAQFASSLPEAEQNFVGNLAVNPVPLHTRSVDPRFPNTPEEMKPEEYEVYAKSLILKMEERYLVMRRSILQQEIKSGQLPAEQIGEKLNELQKIMESLRKFGLFRG